MRLSAGLVYRFGEMNGPLPKSLACDATPSEVYAGERVTLAATVSNYHDKANSPFNFRWELSGGKQQGHQQHGREHKALARSAPKLQLTSCSAPGSKCGGWESNPHALSDKAF